MERFRFWCVAVSVALGAVMSVLFYLAAWTNAYIYKLDTGCGADPMMYAPTCFAVAILATASTYGWTKINNCIKKLRRWLYASYWLLSLGLLIWANFPVCLMGLRSSLP